MSWANEERCSGCGERRRDHCESPEGVPLDDTIGLYDDDRVCGRWIVVSELMAEVERLRKQVVALRFTAECPMCGDGLDRHPDFVFVSETAYCSIECAKADEDQP